MGRRKNKPFCHYKLFPVHQGGCFSFVLKTMFAIFVPLKGFEEGLLKGFSSIKVFFWFSVSHIPSN